MAEQLADETTRPVVAETPKGTWIDSDEILDIETYLRNPSGGFPTIKASVVPAIKSETVNTSKSPETHRFQLSERAKKGMIRAAVVLGVGGIAGTVAVVGITQFNNQPDSALKAKAGSIATQAVALPANGITMEKPLAYGQDSLKPQSCQLPSAVYGVFTVNGSMNLEPEFNNTANPHTLIPLNPYMLPSLESKANQKALKNYNTTTGYNEVTLNNLPLGLTICDLEGAITSNPTTGQYFVDRSKLQLRFEDPSTTSMIDENINPQPQTGSAKGIKLDPNKREYATLPDPRNQMFVPTIPTDKVFNTSRGKFLADMQNPNEVKAILALAVQKAGMVLNADINANDPIFTKGQTISFIDGNKLSDVDTMRDAIDYLLTQRLGVKAKDITFTDSYNAKSDTPVVPTNPSKLITDPSARWIKGLNMNVDFDLTETTIQFGAVKPPTSTVKTAP